MALVNPEVSDSSFLSFPSVDVCDVHDNIGICIRTVLRDIVEVVPSDDNGTGHLGGNDTASQDTATDGNVASEGALLV